MNRVLKKKGLGMVEESQVGFGHGRVEPDWDLDLTKTTRIWAGLRMEA